MSFFLHFLEYTFPGVYIFLRQACLFFSHSCLYWCKHLVNASLTILLNLHLESFSKDLERYWWTFYSAFKNLFGGQMNWWRFFKRPYFKRKKWHYITMLQETWISCSSSVLPGVTHSSHAILNPTPFGKQYTQTHMKEMFRYSEKYLQHMFDPN